MTLATNLGFPRIGKDRELKKALERFWSGADDARTLQATASDLRRRHLSQMKAAGIAHIPTNDFSLYDHMLDTAVMVSAIPKRFRSIVDPLSRYFAMARGLQDPAANIDVPALEMTKWFDTNYHYIVPELEHAQRFALDTTKVFTELDEARTLGIDARPVIVGPVTFLLLSKLGKDAPADAHVLDGLDDLLPVYERLLTQLRERGVTWVQLDEPCLVLDLDAHARAAYRRALPRLASVAVRPKLLLTTYFGELDENLPLATESGFEGLHIDLVRAPSQLESVIASLPRTVVLSMGVVDGRNVWRTDLDAAHALIRSAVRALGHERVLVAPSCSLLHVPVDLERESTLDPELVSWLAFATQKLDAIATLARAATVDAPALPAFDAARIALETRRRSLRTRREEVRSRVETVTEDLLRRSSPYAARTHAQRSAFGLPLLPTTTIGSFPQTSSVRSTRAAHRAGKLTDEAYDAFLAEETRMCVARQEALGLDVLVHGEFERTDMVEHFGEKLEGFAFTDFGWVQSYGSRCVKPPVLFGDVARLEPMTVKWSAFAQSLTKKPMKGMLTGPVTILQWSFVRDDQPRHLTCRQIAVALRDEVRDLEAAGITMIQVDEPAIREGLPLRQRDVASYLRHAVDAFRLATACVRDTTQIHTHMCYSEFGDILSAVAEMDADVVSIETSRSQMVLLDDFGRYAYPNEVGPGVYDIHSPRVPTTMEMVALLLRAADVLPVERLWVNPDCGLKTRGWVEVEAALGSMVEAARIARARFA